MATSDSACASVEWASVSASWASVSSMLLATHVALKACSPVRPQRRACEPLRPGGVQMPGEYCIALPSTLSNDSTVAGGGERLSLGHRALDAGFGRINRFLSNRAASPRFIQSHGSRQAESSVASRRDGRESPSAASSHPDASLRIRHEFSGYSGRPHDRIGAPSVANVRTIRIPWCRLRSPGCGRPCAHSCDRAEHARYRLKASMGSRREALRAG